MLHELVDKDALICADSRELTRYVKRNRHLFLTATSPPYGNAIDYDTHSKGDSKNRYRGNQIWKSREEYISDIAKVFEQVRQVTKIGGYCCIIIGYEVIESVIVPLPSMLITKILSEQKLIRPRRRTLGFTGRGYLEQSDCRKKWNGNRFGSTIKNPFPTYYHANVMHEYIFILSKDRLRLAEKESAKICTSQHG